MFIEAEKFNNSILDTIRIVNKDGLIGIKQNEVRTFEQTIVE